MKKITLLFLFYISLYAKIFLLESKNTKESYLKVNIPFEFYSKELKILKRYLTHLGYKIEIIDEKGINRLKKSDILCLMDTLSLDKKVMEEIISFVKNGGNLLFNFNAGFNYKDYFINKITGFKWYKNRTHIYFKENFYATPKILSPLTKYLPPTKLLTIPIKDKLPIFQIPSYIEPDILATTKNQDRTVVAFRDKDISLKDSGILWHGEKGKGKWVYFNFSLYSLLHLPLKTQISLLKGIIEYLKKDFVIRKYPFLDRENSIFISMNGGYKFENIKNFSRFNIPLTLFLVANSVSRNQKLVIGVSKIKNLEIASLGYTNQIIAGGENEYMKKEILGSKELITSIIQQGVVGFKAPRDKITPKMVKYIIEAGYTYILNRKSDRLYPYFFKNSPLLIIPQKATNDYTFMIDLGWNEKLMLAKMEIEAMLHLYLNGVYALNINSHILGDFMNIDILEELIDYLKQDRYSFLNGANIYYRVKRVKNIEISSKRKDKNFYQITISNKNRQNIKKLKLRLYLKPKEKIKSLYSEKLNISFSKRKTLNEYDIIVKDLKAKRDYQILLEY